MEPITKLLKSKANNGEWNPALRGSLRSAIAGRQYPQARVFAAGWAAHSKRLFVCTNWQNLDRTLRVGRGSMDENRQQEATRQDKVRHKVEATAEQVAQAPVGSLGHRIWKCQSEWMTLLLPRSVTLKGIRHGRGCCSPGQASQNSQPRVKHPSDGLLSLWGHA